MTANCTKCGGKDTLSNHDFFYNVSINAHCPECEQPLSRDFIDKNYGLVCYDCDTGILLADVLPHWSLAVAAAMLRAS